MNLLLRQRNRQIGGIRRQIAAGRFGRRGNFLFCRFHDLARIFFRSSFDARLFGRQVRFSGRFIAAISSPSRDKPRLDLRQPSVGILARPPRLFHRLLNRRRAIAKHSRQILPCRPQHH